MVVAVVVLVVGAVLGSMVGLSACQVRPSAEGATASPIHAPASAVPAVPAVPAPQSADPVVVSLAFAGDVHFAGSSARALTEGLGSGAAPLARADLAIVNLETAVTDRGTAAAKQFTFRAPATALGVLRRGGVDAVSVANNHGLDYGPVGLRDTLAASRAYGLPVIGAGRDERAALSGLTKTVRGVRVSIVSATDVLDSGLTAAWTAGAGRRVDGAPVAYGLGNFVFYTHGGVTAHSGVLSVRAAVRPGSGASGHPRLTTTWHPATIVAGRPVAEPSRAGNALPVC